MLEIGCLTFYELSTLESVIQRGLGVGIDPAAKKLTGPESTQAIKEETCDLNVSSQDTSELSILTIHQSSMRPTDIHRKFRIKDCSVVITWIDVNQNKKSVEVEIKVTKEKNNSDSDDTIIYSLGNIVKAKLTCETLVKR